MSHSRERLDPCREELVNRLTHQAAARCCGSSERTRSRGTAHNSGAKLLQQVEVGFGSEEFDAR